VLSIRANAQIVDVPQAVCVWLSLFHACMSNC